MYRKSRLFLGLCLCAIAAAGLFFLFPENRREKGETVEIGVSLYLEEDTFVEKILSGMEEAARAYEEETGKNVVLNVLVANGSQRTQNEQVKRFVALGYDAVCVNLVDRTSASAIIDEVLAADQETPVVFFNREPVEADILRGEHIYYVGSDAKESAVLQGETVVESLQKHPEMDKNGDGVLQYVMLEGEMGHQDTIMRSEYSLRTIGEAGISLQKLDSATADWNRSSAEALMEQWIKTYGDAIELVLCNNDDMALGAADALEKAEQTAAVFGIDATGVGMEAVEAGRLWATVDCNGALQGKMVFSIATGLAEKGRIPDEVPLSEERYVRVALSKRMTESLKK